MKIFIRNGNINFVDATNAFVGFDYTQDCCESFGYVITSKQPDLIRHEQESEALSTEGFVFDREYMQELAGEAVTFRLTKGEDEIFLTLYNHHNGYYGHGFEFFDENFTLLKKGVL